MIFSDTVAVVMHWQDEPAGSHCRWLEKGGV